MAKDGRAKSRTQKPTSATVRNKFDPALKKRLQKQRKVNEQDHVLKDERFSKIATDPRFRGIPLEERKVQIDPRFKGMFTDQHFNQKHSVDKRGRPVRFASADNLKKFYQLKGDGKRKDEQKEALPTGNFKRTNGDVIDERFKFGESSRVSDGSSSSEESDEEDASKDLSRGRGNVSSSSEEGSGDEDDVGIQKEELVHPWAELAADAPATDEITRRLALVNMDWDYIRAEDIFALLNSYKPVGGQIKSVTIYPSEFGLKRMKEEEWNGPLEMKKEDPVTGKPNDDGDQNESEEDGEREDEDPSSNNEKLRRYQLSRLKYYYAVIECDSPASANKIYEECDGYEYGNSSAPIDLRFVPDEMVFDEQPSGQASGLPANYQPSEFVISALQQSAVKSSWDETPRDRKPLNALVVKDVDDLQTFLASSSSEEEEDVADDCLADSAETRSVKSKKDSETIAKYRDLLLSMDNQINDKDDTDESDVDMEMTWEPGVKVSVDLQIKSKQKESEISALTPFEKMMERQKEKRKARKRLKKDVTLNLEKAWKGDAEDDLTDTTECDAELEDRKDEKTELPTESDANKGNSKDELALLIGDPDGKRHFNLTDLMSEVKDSPSQKKKRRRLLAKKKTQPLNDEDDNFQMDLQDDRFSALFTSNQFNVDLSDPSFRRTKGMDAIAKEKISRKTLHEGDDLGKVPKQNADAPKIRPAIASLAKSVKAKVLSTQKKGQ